MDSREFVLIASCTIRRGIPRVGCEYLVGRRSFYPPNVCTDRVFARGSANSTGLNLQQAWTQLLAKLEPSAGGLRVSAAQIKSLTGVEPRLATKFDHREARPEALRQSTILPVKNGEYLVVAGDGYHDLEPSAARVVNYRVPAATARRTSTLPWSEVPSSESQVLDMAVVSGMLGQFLGEETLHLTVRGRLRSPRFDFTFGLSDGSRLGVEVEGVQIEADAGVEGDSFYLIEAKLGRRDNFHVRQLYYPYRMWRATCSKPVFPVFCCHSDRVFHFWLYEFAPSSDYHGLRLLKQTSYSLDEEVGTPTLANLLATYPPVGLPPGIPLPQADRLERVIDLVDAVASGASDYGFLPRQADYYRNAAAFLGLLEAGQLTALGRKFTGGSRGQRHAILVQRLVELPILREACEFMEAEARFPSSAWVAERMLAATDRLSSSTVQRRARTVLAWLQWLSTHTLVAHDRVS